MEVANPIPKKLHTSRTQIKVMYKIKLFSLLKCDFQMIIVKKLISTVVQKTPYMTKVIHSVITLSRSIKDKFRSVIVFPIRSKILTYKNVRTLTKGSIPSHFINVHTMIKHIKTSIIKIIKYNHLKLFFVN
jgi:hypothetical protein